MRGEKMGLLKAKHYCELMQRCFSSWADVMTLTFRSPRWFNIDIDHKGYNSWDRIAWLQGHFRKIAGSESTITKVLKANAKGKDI